jgi:ABC-2 type transport system permease protein
MTNIRLESTYVPNKLRSADSLLAESLLFASRRFLRWRRDPILPIQCILLPTALLVVYRLLAGKSIMRITGTDSLYALVPMCAIAGGMFGALVLGLSIASERNSHLLTRFWTLPVHRGSALLGTLLAESARALIGAVLITFIGALLGLRFFGNWLSILGFVMVPVAVVAVFAVMVIAISVRTPNNVLLTWLGTGSIGMVFGSSGMAPVNTFPSWLQPLIRYQPMSTAIDTMKYLALGQPSLVPFAITCLWLAVVAVIVVPLAVRGYRAAALWSS